MKWRRESTKDEDYNNSEDNTDFSYDKLTRGRTPVDKFPTEEKSDAAVALFAFTLVLFLISSFFFSLREE